MNKTKIAKKYVFERQKDTIIAQLNADIFETKKRNKRYSELEQKYRTLEERYQNLLQAKDEFIIKSAKNKEKIEFKISEFEKNIKICAENLRNKENEILKGKNKICENEKIIDKINTEITMKKSDILNKNNEKLYQIDTNIKIKNEIENESNTIQELHMKIDNFINENEKINFQNTNILNKIKENNEIIIKLKNNIEISETQKNSILHLKNSQNTEIEKEISSLRNRQDENQKILTENTNLKKSNDLLKFQINASETKIAEFSKKLLENENQMEKIYKKISDEKSKLFRQNYENENIQNSIQKENIKNIMLRKEIENLRDYFARYKKITDENIFRNYEFTTKK